VTASALTGAINEIDGGPRFAKQGDNDMDFLVEER
jgi:hypothetical protein